MNILVDSNIDWESETTTHSITSNGGDSILEPNLSELKEEETLLFLDRMVNASTMELMLSSDNGREKFTNGLATTVDQEETLETQDVNALTSMEDKTDTTFTVAGWTATTVNIKDGNSTQEVSAFQDTHLEMVLGSRLDQEWVATDKFTRLSTLDHTNTDWDSKTLTLETNGHGSSLTKEPNPSEPGLEEIMRSRPKLTHATDVEMLLMWDNGRMRSINELHGTEDQEETLETWEDSALTFTETVTLMEDTFTGGLAIMVSTKAGTSLKRLAAL